MLRFVHLLETIVSTTISIILENNCFKHHPEFLGNSEWHSFILEIFLRCRSIRLIHNDPYWKSVIIRAFWENFLDFRTLSTSEL